MRVTNIGVGTGVTVASVTGIGVFVGINAGIAVDVGVWLTVEHAVKRIADPASRIRVMNNLGLDMQLIPSPEELPAIPGSG